MRKNESLPDPAEWYAAVPSPPPLADWVLEFWEMRIPGLPRPARIRILPNACVDVVLYATETARGEGAAAIVAPPHRSFVVGSTLRSFIMQGAGWHHVIGATIRPTGVEPLLGLPAAAIGQSVALLHDIVGPRAQEIEDRILSGPPEGALRRMVEVFLELRRTGAEAPRDAVAHQAVHLVQRAHGRRRIDALAGDLSVSARRLERNFLAQVGMSPKLFSRLVRFDRAVRDLGGRGATSWAQFALGHGYTDQAHFINEFQEFAGVSPAEFEAEARGLEGGVGIDVPPE